MLCVELFLGNKLIEALLTVLRHSLPLIRGLAQRPGLLPCISLRCKGRYSLLCLGVWYDFRDGRHEFSDVCHRVVYYNKDMDAEQPAVSSSVSEPESKRVARLAQLSSARDSAANKKRQRDVDIAEIKDSIKLIDQKLSTDETPVIEKRQRVITKQDETPEPESWTTTMIRTTAVLGLASASYWFQHRYGKILPIIKRNRNQHAETGAGAVVACSGSR